MFTATILFLGGIACLISIFKPDPQGELDANVEEYEKLGADSIVELLRDWVHLPAVKVTEGNLDWMFENNQGAMAQTKGLEPNNPLTFNYDEVPSRSRIKYVPKSTCPKTDGLPRCIGIGDTRQMGKFLILSQQKPLRAGTFAKVVLSNVSASESFYL